MRLLKALALRIFERKSRFLRLYSATVQHQHDDDTLDLMPDDSRVRGTGLQRVSIRHGLPGVRVRVAQGAIVRLGYENGDPRRPYAALWNAGSIEQLSFDGGTQPIARKGDPVRVYWPATCQIVGTLGPLPFTGTITIATASAGVIEGGKDNVLA